MRRARAVAGLCCILLGGCAVSKPYRPQTYVVRPQDTLYSIAWRHNLDYRELAKWNDIGSDYRLSVGQVLMLEAGARPGARGASVSSKPGFNRSVTGARPGGVNPASAAVAPATGDGAGTNPGTDHRAVGAAPRDSLPGRASSRGSASRAATAPRDSQSAALGGGAKWLWPTDRNSPPRPVPGGGIELFGRLGQEIRSAGAGHVVYTGNGIRGYGNLIIIKHGESLLSSYAHNRDVLVHEGEDVNAGQTIAHMGMGSHQISALYFEIRVNGKPTDPLPLLPKSE